MDGMLASVLIGLAVLVVSLLILHFTPESRDRRG
jgi:hypothetical protein